MILILASPASAVSATSLAVGAAGGVLSLLHSQVALTHGATELGHTAVPGTPADYKPDGSGAIPRPTPRDRTPSRPAPIVRQPAPSPTLYNTHGATQQPTLSATPSTES